MATKRESTVSSTGSNSKRKKAKKEEPRQAPYDETQEALPQLSVYHAGFREAERRVPIVCAMVLRKISDLKIASFQDGTIDRVAKGLSELLYPASRYPAARRIGFLGDTAAGKSSLINCLLGQEVTAECDDGDSGTHVIVEIVKAPPSQKTPYEATVYFHDVRKIQRLIEKHFHDIHEDLIAPKADLSIEEVTELGIRRHTALDFFVTLLCDHEEFATDQAAGDYFQQTKDDSTHERVMARLLELIMAYLDSLECNGHLKKFSSNNLREVIQPLQKFCRPSRATGDSSAPSPWPLISRAQVHFHCRLLDAGLVLVDLPGVTDRNLSRVETTKEYLKTCSAIIIANPIVRISTSSSLTENLRECERKGKIKDTIIVATKIDDIKPLAKPKGGDTNLPGWPQKDIDEYHGLEEDVLRIESEIEEIEDDDDDEPRMSRKEAKLLKEKLDGLLAQTKAKQIQKQIQVRNDKIRDAMGKVCARVGDSGEWSAESLMFVSNLCYQQHLSGYKLAEPPKLDLEGCGIPKLRSMLYKIPARERMAALEQICQEDLPLALNALKGRCGKDRLERKEDVQALVITPKSTCENAIAKARKSFEDKFESIVLSFITERQPQWSLVAQRFADEWEHHKASTFNAICRNHGEWIRKIPGGAVPFNWNQNLVEIYEEEMDERFLLLGEAISEIEKDITNLVKSLLDELVAELQQCPFLMGLELGPFFHSISIRRKNASRHISEILDQLKNKVNEINFNITSPDADGYMRRCMDPTYQECINLGKKHKVKNVTSRRKAILSEKLESDIFMDCALRAKAAFQRALESWFTKAMDERENIFGEILKELGERFESAETEEDDTSCFRMELHEVVKEAEKILEGPIMQNLEECAKYGIPEEVVAEPVKEEQGPEKPDQAGDQEESIIVAASPQVETDANGVAEATVPPTDTRETESAVPVPDGPEKTEVTVQGEPPVEGAAREGLQENKTTDQNTI